MNLVSRVIDFIVIGWFVFLTNYQYGQIYGKTNFFMAFATCMMARYLWGRTK